MASNITTTYHIKHMDFRYKYINEYVEDGFGKIFFLKSTDTDSNILTKNLSAERHKKNSRKMVGEKLQGVATFKNIWS